MNTQPDPPADSPDGSAELLDPRLDAAGLAKLKARVLLPIATSMLTSDELQDVEVVVAEDGSVVAMVRAGDELSQHFLWSPGQESTTLGDVAERFASELQDFIAESRFGWGQLRHPRPL